MALYELLVLRDNVIGTMGEPSEDSWLTQKGNEADAQIRSELITCIRKLGNIKALPVIDIANGTINGTAAPKDVISAATNRATALALYKLRQKEMGDMYYGISKNALDAYIVGIEGEQGSTAFSII